MEALRNYVEAQGFSGYDPYDALNSRIPFQKLGKWPSVLMTQALKRLPLNLRPLLGIKKGINSKAMGLFLHAHSLMYRMEPDPQTRANMDFIFNWLAKNISVSHSGAGWGYNFPWVGPVKTIPAFMPSAVVTGFVCRGISAYHQVTGDPRAVDLLVRAARFIREGLERTAFPEGLCFSYSPVARDCCYNASLLAAEVLALADKAVGEGRYRDMVRRAVDFVVSRQKEDGRWNYHLNFESGEERPQVDFHQGYVVESINRLGQIMEIRNADWTNAVERGARFYKENQFTPNGRALWRWPKNWPVDIHHQAQGIITFAQLGHLDPDYPEFADCIAEWTIENMRSPKGYFFYRKYRIGGNHIPFMRWAQAWMMLSLVICR